MSTSTDMINEINEINEINAVNTIKSAYIKYILNLSNIDEIDDFCKCRQCEFYSNNIFDNRIYIRNHTRLVRAFTYCKTCFDELYTNTNGIMIYSIIYDPTDYIKDNYRRDIEDQLQLISKLQQQLIYPMRSELKQIIQTQVFALKSLDTRTLILKHDMLAFRGNLRMIRILRDNPTSYDRPTYIGANAAASKGYLDILKFFKNEYNVICTRFGADLAAENGHLHIFKYLNEECNIKCTQLGADLALKNNHTHIFDYICANYPISIDMNA
jgi:hypothetical protein